MPPGEEGGIVVTSVMRRWRVYPAARILNQASLGMTDCTERHTPAADDGIAGESQEGMPEEAQTP
jgi:hypothetical protein